jgi:hypothetical protein
MKVLRIAVVGIATLCCSHLMGQVRGSAPGRMGGGQFSGAGTTPFKRGASGNSFRSGSFNNKSGRSGFGHQFGNRFGFGNGCGVGNGFGFGTGIGFGSGFGFGNGCGFGNGLGFGFGYAGFDPFYGYDSPFDPFYARYAGYGNNEESQQPSQPSVILMMPQMPPPPVPVVPIRPETREYNWPVSSPDSAAVFTLVSKDQRVESAIAVTVEGNRILYVTPDGIHKQMSMDTLDRERTRQRNAEKQLRLPWLPGGNG